MSGRNRPQEVRGVVFVNLQKRYVIRTSTLMPFVRGLKRSLQLEKQKFNVCFVDDNSIRHLNLAYRGKNKSTDVLSFPWNEPGSASAPGSSHAHGKNGFEDFLGDIVISVETAGRNAELEGHSRLLEIRWLILHGLLHLLGFDHETDSGQMVALELALREQLGITGWENQTRLSKPRRKGEKPDQPNS
jgi:probable rRNA maturation factor